MRSFLPEYQQCQESVEVITLEGSCIFNKTLGNITHFGQWGMTMQSLLVLKGAGSMEEAIEIISKEAPDDAAIAVN